MNAKNFLILDTETVCLKGKDGKNRQCVYNIAWTVMRKNGKVISQQSYLVTEMFNDYKNIVIRDSIYFNAKQGYYKKQLFEKITHYAKWTDILLSLQADLTVFNIDTICAYNVKSDKIAIQNTSFILNKQVIENNNNTIQILDKIYNVYNIQLGAVEIICNTKKYKDFCFEHSFFSQNFLQYSTKAETLLRYIRNNYLICEQHTALEDTQIEAEVLTRILKKKSQIVATETNGNIFVYNTPLNTKQKEFLISAITEYRDSYKNIKSNYYNRLTNVIKKISQ